MKRRFRDISIRHKLLVISVVVTFVVLGFSSAMLITTIWSNERTNAVVELQGIARLIGANSTAALVFDDADGAREILETLSTDNDIVLGMLFDSSGNEVSRFQAGPHEHPPTGVLEGGSSTLIHGMNVTTYQPILLDDQKVGSILLQSTLHSRLESLYSTILPIAIVLITTFATALIVALKLARSITNPIQDLGHLLDHVSSQDDYSLRYHLDQSDEIGLLTRGVNDMLARIEQRDAEIGAHRQELEQQVESRTAELKSANTRIKTELEELGRAEKDLKEAHHSLELQNNNFSLLSEMSERLQVCHSIEEIKPVVAYYLRKLFSASSGGLFIYNHSRSMLETAAVWGSTSPHQDLFRQGDCWALRQGRIHVVDDPDTDLICPHCADGTVNSYICAPMIAYGEVLGVLHVSGIDVARISISSQQVITSVAEHLALAIANLRLREALELKSVRDNLTGLFNRRYLHEILERELARSNRTASNTALLMIDIDHFKNFNDTHGQEAGDIALHEFAAFLKHVIRTEDVVCRYGGEEFVIILPGTDADIAAQRAEQIRRGTKNLQLQHKGKTLPKISVSIGISVSPNNGDSVDGLIAACDEALNTAKHEGRDRVRLALLANPGNGTSSILPIRRHNL